MSFRIAVMGASLLVLASAAAAQAAEAPPLMAAAAPAEEATLGEIVVTARRKSESLQEVPQTVNAVTSESIQKLNLTTFRDIQTVVPGLTLQQGNSSTSAAASLRGVTYSALTGGQATVAEYINDAPVNALEMFQSLFDVGQIEVLKGPQGTTRGVSAPSGAITFSTRKPDLSEFGGYISGIATDLHGRNVQGALNIPIIKDVLAVRLAGVLDQTDNDGVRSVNNALRPSNKTTGERISVSFEPNDKLNANIMYQHMDHTLAGYEQVEGPGFGVNPTISADQRVGVQDQPTTFSQHFDRVSAQVDSHIFGQHLSYVGSYSFFKLKSATTQDPANVIPFADPQQQLLTSAETTTHEIRLASDPAPGRFFDYTVGAYYQWSTPQTTGGQPAALLPGAFGPPNAQNTAAFNPAFSIPVSFGGPPSPGQETSIFGSVTFHLGANTELSGGVRHIISVGQINLVTELGNGLLALPASTFGGNCGQLPSTYAGYCNLTLNTASVISNTTSRNSDRANIYNISLSHHLTRDLLVYANTGTSWGQPLPTFGLQGEITGSTDPLVSSFTFHPASTSRSYEVGVKSTFLDGRGRVNFALYRQKFHNLFIGVPGINYLNATPVSSSVSQADFSASVDTLVQGVDLDGAFQITPEWNIQVQASYAHSELDQGALTPCNTFGANGAPTFNRQFVSVCPGGRASRLPLWNLTAQTEYVHPVHDDVDGFIRGLFNYYPQNKYVETNFTAPSYSLLNIYLGLRSHDGAWEASIFARNAFSTDKVLDRSQQTINSSGLVSTFFPALNLTPTYYSVNSETPRREVGVSLRYAFGSR